MNYNVKTLFRQEICDFKFVLVFQRVEGHVFGLLHMNDAQAAQSLSLCKK